VNRLVVLRFPAVNRFHGERVTQDEFDPFGRADVGEPTPGEHAFRRHDEIVAVRPDRLEERLGTRFDVAVYEHLAHGVENADVHRLDVEIDAAVCAGRA
jgi:hypothetical protein